VPASTAASSNPVAMRSPPLENATLRVASFSTTMRAQRLVAGGVNANRPNRAQLDAVMVRRMKPELKRRGGRRHRQVNPHR